MEHLGFLGPGGRECQEFQESPVLFQTQDGPLTGLKSEWAKDESA